MLKSLFQEQLSVEMATTVTVASVEKAPSLTKEVLQAVRGPDYALGLSGCPAVL